MKRTLLWKRARRGSNILWLAQHFIDGDYIVWTKPLKQSKYFYTGY